MLMDIHEVKSKSSILSCLMGTTGLLGGGFYKRFYGRGMLSVIIISGVEYASVGTLHLYSLHGNYCGVNG